MSTGSTSARRECHAIHAKANTPCRLQLCKRTTSIDCSLTQVFQQLRAEISYRRTHKTPSVLVPRGGNNLDTCRVTRSGRTSKSASAIRGMRYAIRFLLEGGWGVNYEGPNPPDTSYWRTHTEHRPTLTRISISRKTGWGRRQYQKQRGLRGRYHTE